ncbi:MAG TPA: ATP-binding protein [Sphingobium sp.]
MTANGFLHGWRWLLVGVSIAIAAALLASGVAERRTLAALRERAATDARLRAALLDSELARFRLLPLALADDRDVTAAVGGAVAARAPLNRKLQTLAQVTGAAVIYVVEPDGRAISASNWRAPQSFVGNDYRFRPYFREARLRGEGSQYAMGTVSGRPGLYLARRTGDGGVIVVKLEFDRIERQWANAGGVTLVRNGAGVVLVTSRPDWRFHASGPLSSAERTRLRDETRAPAAALSPLPLARGSASDILVGAGGRFVTHDVTVAQSGWRLTLLLPIDAALSSARRTAALSAALVAIALVAAFWALRQRMTLAQRRTTELEQVVAQRTADLRREMDERAESEVRAAELREALRQANRLASLGQITASVAHETAQPVAAIRTYAQTSDTLLGRGDLDEVRANLGAIARLADRIGAVTAQLRGFSRRQAGDLRPVKVAEVIDGAVLILKEQLRSATLLVPVIDPDLTVIGGKVRLEQVLVNLIQNALEAIAGGKDRRIALELAIDADHLRLTVTDSGPGIAADVAERLFTPFVTSREKGLGLGLVIAQDIMVELGGWLRLLPSESGARFEIGMRRA